MFTGFGFAHLNDEYDYAFMRFEAAQQGYDIALLCYETLSVDNPGESLEASFMSWQEVNEASTHCPTVLKVGARTGSTISTM